MKPAEKTPPLRAALQPHQAILNRVVFFSFFINLLVMTPTVYMLQVYDRVVTSASFTTLAMLSLLAVACYAVLEALEWTRTMMLQGLAQKFDAALGERLFDTVFEARLRRQSGGSAQALQDLRTLREFIPGPAVTAIIDIPLALLYVLVIFAVNPIMGWVSVVGALLQVGLAWLTEHHTRKPLASANRAAIGAQNYAANSLRNAQVIEAMGMQHGIHQRWLEKQKVCLREQAHASDKAGGYSALARFVQQTQSSLLLGIGCGLTILNLFPGGGGMMMVASALGGRLLSPLVQAIGAWKQVQGAREAAARLDSLLETVALRPAGMPLPAPRGLLSVEGVVGGPPGAPGVLRGISFSVAPGTVLGLLGPSASGKSTLARLLVGAWPAASGKVRLDGVDLHPWHKAELGPHLGYLPQEVALFDGSIADNIARFGAADPAALEAAARAVGIHEMILALPAGYATPIGDGGCFLSGGQRQRIGLARAIYRRPRLIVLDEPNSSLDEAGEQALVSTLLALKAGGATVIVITHRSSVLAATDQLLILQDGQVKVHGPRDDVLAALQRAAAQAQAPATAPRPAAA